MTPVQQKVLTELPSSSSECLVQAKTGTGKTIAFLLPALQALLSGKPLPSGQVGILILSPTRELALQIAKECDQITASLPQRLECHTAFGGTARASNLKKFLHGKPTVLVATPGRLNDYLTEESARGKFQDIRTLILDEADTMLEQGFLLAIKDILKKLPPKKAGWQGMCFSATIPAKVTDVVKIVLNPGYTHLSTVDQSEPPTVANVPQYFITIPRMMDTFNALFALIKLEYAHNPTEFKAIVFGTTANGVALLAALFTKLMPEFKVYQLQSRLSQSVRTRTTDEFKAASSGLMFASDVIGRGMDFPNVGHVFQLGLPASGEQYVHRVGRTARAGNDGRAVILLNENESYFPRINKLLPINPYPTDLAPHISSVSAEVSVAFESVDEVTKSKAYQAFLGFNKTFLKNLRLDTPGLVRMANEYANAMGCPEPPMVDKKVVGKMGLKGVMGLRVGTIERDEPPRQGPRQGLRQGPRPERAIENAVTNGKERWSTNGRNGSNGDAPLNNRWTRAGGQPLGNGTNGRNSGNTNTTRNGGGRGKRRGGAGGVDDRATKR